MCVTDLFLESTVIARRAERLSILTNVKRSKDLHSSILLTTGGPDILTVGDKNASLTSILANLSIEMQAHGKASMRTP